MVVSVKGTYIHVYMHVYMHGNLALSVLHFSAFVIKAAMLNKEAIYNTKCVQYTSSFQSTVRPPIKCQNRKKSNDLCLYICMYM